MARRGRPRKIGAKRHPDGTVVRTVCEAGKRISLSLWQSAKDSLRATRDQREGSAAGRLELRGASNRGITRFEKLAGERWAQVVNAWRIQIASSPNPNAPAADLQGGTGRAPQGDPFNLSDTECDRLDHITAHYEAAETVIRGLKEPTKVRDALEAIFIREIDVDTVTLRHARRGLKPLIFHFGLTGEDDSRYINRR